MELAYKPDFERARTCWDAFWQHEIIDRPCTVIRAAKTENPKGYARLQPVTGDFEKAVREFDGYLETHAFLGEAIPSFRPGFGPDQVAGFLGAPIVISQDSQDTSWSEKIVDDWNSFLPLEIDENNPCWQGMIQFHRAAETHLRGRCLLQEIDLHSNIDALEGLRGAQKLIYDMIDEPEIVLRAMAQVRRVYKQVSETFYALGDKQTWGTTCALPFYSRGRFNRIQSDFIALLNPELFRKFVFEAIQEEAQFLDHSCFHLDGPDALTHLEDILSIREIDAIEWVSGAGNRPQFEWPDLLHRIQDAGKAIILHLTPDEVRHVHGEYRPDLVVYDVTAQSEEAGVELLEWLKDNT